MEKNAWIFVKISVNCEAHTAKNYKYTNYLKNEIENRELTIKKC